MKKIILLGLVLIVLNVLDAITTFLVPLQFERQYSNPIDIDMVFETTSIFKQLFN